MLRDRLPGLSVTLIDERIVETFRFASDHVAATIGTADGAVCAPILSLGVVEPASLRISGEGFEILWERIEIGPEVLSAVRNGDPVVYRIDARATGRVKRARLP